MDKEGLGGYIDRINARMCVGHIERARERHRETERAEHRGNVPRPRDLHKLQKRSWKGEKKQELWRIL